jgi:hypothetical protein
LYRYVTERERVEREAARERAAAEKEITKEKDKEDREAARKVAQVQREKEKELEKAARALEREAAKGERDKKRAVEAAAAQVARAKEAQASQWLNGAIPREPDAPAAGAGAGDSSLAVKGPVTPPPPPEGFGSFSATPELAGDLLEVWAFVDRFRDVLFAEPAVKKEEEEEEDDKPRRGGRRSKTPEPDARAPAEAAPPTPAALAAALALGDPACGAALVGALLAPLLASHAATAPTQLLADALALSPPPATDAQLSVPGGVWEETLRRYLFGAAAAMDLPPPPSNDGRWPAAAADASEVVCKWVCSGGPTAMPTPPDTGTVMTPSAAAAWAATMEGLPKPPPALAARADAEALAACEIELYVSGAEGTRGETERRQKGVAAAAAAASSGPANAVRQAVRVLAHSEKFRHPALGRAAMREHGNSAAGVPYFAAVAAGAGTSAAARAKFPRAVDYEAIDARAAAGVYAVANLSSTVGDTSSLGSFGAGSGGADAMVRADTAECGEMLLAAGAPDKSTPHAVPARVERAARRGKPEGRGKDGLVAVEGVGELPLFGSEAAALPKVAWDDGCAVCGGDIAAGPVLLCDSCDGEYHCACLSPPLAAVPDDDWFCPHCERAQERVDCESRELVALKGTQLDFAVAGQPAAGTGGSGGGSTRQRAEAARRLRGLAVRLLDGGGWGGLTPAERLGALRELTWQLLDCSLVRATLESGEKKTGEAREALRRHVRDWTSYRKHGISGADAAAVAAAARANAEDKAEAAEADAKAAGGGTGADDNDAAAKEKEDGNGDDDGGGDGDGGGGGGGGGGPAVVKSYGHGGARAGAGAKKGGGGGGKAAAPKNEGGGNDDDGGGGNNDGGGGVVMKSYAVRMAGIAAANAALAVVSEDEGRVRWQAKWHELERTLRAADLRLEAMGADRHGAAYWLLAPWGQVAVQPAGSGRDDVAAAAKAAITKKSRHRRWWRKPKDGEEGRRVGAGKGGGGAGGDLDTTMEEADEGEEDEEEEEGKEGEEGEDDYESDEPAGVAAAGCGFTGEPEKPAAESAWGMYSGGADVAGLAASLNQRGFREGTLWSELERRFGAPELPPAPADAPVKMETNEEAAEEEGMKKSGDDDDDDDNNASLPPLGSIVTVPPPPAAGGEWKPPLPVGAPVTSAAATIAVARSELLALDAGLPDGAEGTRALCPVRASPQRRAAWRRLVTAADAPLPLAMATCLLEVALRRDWLSPAWLPWSPPAPALRAASVANPAAAAAAVLLRVHVLRRAIVWPGSRSGGGGGSSKRGRAAAAAEEVVIPAESREARTSRRAAAMASAVGLSKFARIQLTHSLKAPGFINP